jgi:mono/diheme cytochrome c family protein
MRIYFALHLSLAAMLAHLSVAPASAQPTTPVLVDQGSGWTAVTRADFYGRDQGSKMIPLDWLRALKQANGQPFLADGLARYGYLPNPANTSGLPVGFTASGPSGLQIVGMTCSACHTRQINVDGKAYRIDGGPAIVDFQSLLSDLDVAVGTVLASDTAFIPFATLVLGSGSPDSEDVSTLRRNVDAWYLRYHALMSRALPKAPTPSWGPARLDAVGMIFNRLTGLDLGPAPSFVIPGNIKMADAPVRYPFLWNAARQDATQWSGFAGNGDGVLALGRNLGQVFGVFGVFQPAKKDFLMNFLNNNSANFDGLSDVEDMIKLIGPPKWQWPVDAALAAQGKQIYERDYKLGGCANCHDINPGKLRFPLQQTWDTPVWNVGTDTRQFDILTWNVSTGVLQGAVIPVLTKPLGATDTAFNTLTTSVIGSITDHYLSGGGGAVAIQQAPNQFEFAPHQLSGSLPPALRELQSAFRPPGTAAEAPQGILPSPQAPGAPTRPATVPSKGAYESRVLQGIWAAAPYLHNGSVPSLAELLKPASQRVAKFKIGPAYDTVNIGLATEQTQFNYELETTDCSNLNSGNSRCGHEFGTQLSPDEKKALLEYLKTL